MSICNLFSEGAGRTVNVAVALVGCPAVLLLDEPTMRMDPVSKRRTWDILANYITSGRTIVVMSHS